MRHELHLLVRGLRALGVAAVFLAVLGALIAGVSGAASAMVAAGLVAANHGLAALSTGWAPTLRPGVLAVSYGGFFVRMLALLGVFLLLAGRSWVHPEVFAAAFGVCVAVALTTECLSYVRGSYVPAWRTGGERR